MRTWVTLRVRIFISLIMKGAEIFIDILKHYVVQKIVFKHFKGEYCEMGILDIAHTNFLWRSKYLSSMEERIDLLGHKFHQNLSVSP